jgi:hypothetical protein
MWKVLHFSVLVGCSFSFSGVVRLANRLCGGPRISSAALNAASHKQTISAGPHVLSPSTRALSGPRRRHRVPPDTRVRVQGTPSACLAYSGPDQVVAPASGLGILSMVDGLASRRAASPTYHQPILVNTGRIPRVTAQCSIGAAQGGSSPRVEPILGAASNEAAEVRAFRARQRAAWE